MSLSADDSGAMQVAVWTAASGVATLRDLLGTSTDTYAGSFGTPAEIVLGGRYAGAPFGYAAIDVLATVGASRALDHRSAAADRGQRQVEPLVADRRPQISRTG